MLRRLGRRYLWGGGGGGEAEFVSPSGANSSLEP